jgi:CO/xanthine dehydrogenase FAD-binding subunit
MRLTATDFPILVCAVTKEGETVRAAVGARPQRAALRETEAKALADPQTFAEKMTDGYTFGSNLRGSAAYRQHLCRVLLTRAASELKEETGCS